MPSHCMHCNAPALCKGDVAACILLRSLHTTAYESHTLKMSPLNLMGLISSSGMDLVESMYVDLVGVWSVVL